MIRQIRLAIQAACLQDGVPEPEILTCKACNGRAPVVKSVPSYSNVPKLMSDPIQVTGTNQCLQINHEDPCDSCKGTGQLGAQYLLDVYRTILEKRFRYRQLEVAKVAQIISAIPDSAERPIIDYDLGRWSLPKLRKFRLGLEQKHPNRIDGELEFEDKQKIDATLCKASAALLEVNGRLLTNGTPTRLSSVLIPFSRKLRELHQHAYQRQQAVLGERSRFLENAPIKNTSWRKESLWLTTFNKRQKFHGFNYGSQSTEKELYGPSQKPEWKDVIQCTTLNNCYLIAAIGALAQTHPGHIDRLFRKNIVEGLWDVHLYLKGKWIWVTVDEYFPMMKRDLIATATSKWFFLLEKAIAVMLGTYISDEWDYGNMAEAMLWLTSSPTHIFSSKVSEGSSSCGGSHSIATAKYRLKYEQRGDGECLTFPKQELSFERMHFFHKNNFPIVAGSKNHMYGVTNVYYGNDAGCKTENVLVFDPYSPENAKVMPFADFMRFTSCIQVGIYRPDISTADLCNRFEHNDSIYKRNAKMPGGSIDSSEENSKKRRRKLRRQRRVKPSKSPSRADSSAPEVDINTVFDEIANMQPPKHDPTMDTGARAQPKSPEKSSPRIVKLLTSFPKTKDTSEKPYPSSKPTFSKRVKSARLQVSKHSKRHTKRNFSRLASRGHGPKRVTSAKGRRA